MIRPRCAAPSSSTRTRKFRCASSSIAGLINCSASFPTDIHLIGPAKSGDRLYLLGADAVGRDVFSRMIYGTRVSMTIGLVGVAISLVLGIFLGGISGYYGGWIDDLIQRSHRLYPLAADHSLVARFGRCLPDHMGAAANLLRHHDHSVVHRLDGAGARGTRAFSGAAHRGFRHGGAAGWREPDERDLSSTCSRPFTATSSPRSHWRSRR